MLYKTKEVEAYLNEVLGPETDEIVTAITSEPGTKASYFITIPDASTIDLHVDDLASLVARTSNIYGRAARFAGMARAKYKLAEARYKYKFKTTRSTGKNDVEREAERMEAAQEEYMALSVAEAKVQLAESMENAARVASETARKLYDKAKTVNVAYAAESKGYLKNSDWSNDF